MAFPSLTRQPDDAWHPRWCAAEACTAYADPEAVERRYHRSSPIVVETDDPFVSLYVHLGTSADGGSAYVGMSELERPFILPWFEEEPICARSFAMPVEQADELRHALACAVRAGQPTRLARTVRSGRWRLP